MVVILGLSVGFFISAQSIPKNNVSKYTKEQEDCIAKNQSKGVVSIQKEFNSATKEAKEIRKSAMRSAQALTNSEERLAAIRLANKNYSENPAVKESSEKYRKQMADLKEKAIKNCTSVPYFFNSLGSVMSKSLAALSGLGNNKKENKQNNISNKSSTSTPEYTEKQKECIKTAQEKRNKAIEPFKDEMQKQNQEAMKLRQEAIKAAQKITDKKKREEAIKNANELFNNSQNNGSYNNEVKAANEQFKKDQKACMGKSVADSKGFFEKIGNGFSSFGMGSENCLSEENKNI